MAAKVVAVVATGEALRAAVGAREKALKANAQMVASRIWEQCSKNDSEAGRQTGVEQQVISDARRSEKLGLRNILKIAAAAGLSLDQLEKLRNDDAVVPITRGMIVLGESAGWADAVTTAQAKHPHIPDWAWRSAGGMTLPLLPREVGPELAFTAASLIAQHCDLTQEVRIRRKKRGTE